MFNLLGSNGKSNIIQEREPIQWRTLLWQLTTVDGVNEKCINWSPCNQNFLKINKFEALAFKKVVNHSCLGECSYSSEQNSDQQFQHKVHCPFSKIIFFITEVGETMEDLDTGRIWTVGLPHEWLMSLQKCHLKGISFDKSILSTIFVEVLIHFLRRSHILFDFGPLE